MTRHLLHFARSRLASLSLLALALVAPGRAAAQSQPAPSGTTPAPEPEAAQTKPPPPDPRDIVVFGNVALPASLKDLEVEQVYDPDRVSSYGVSTIGELLDAITFENGDTAPQILVNGQVARNVSEISDLPVEAVARVEELPRGAATRVGGAPGQRAYNVVLRSRVRTFVATSAYQAATEGGWDNLRADGTLTWIRKNDRINLTARGAWSGSLLESERDLTPLPPTIAYSPLGNVLGSSGGEIDPALSLLAGQTVTVAGVPAGQPNPTLAQFAATSGQANPSDLSRYRTLRGRARPYEVNLAASKELSPWLSVSFNGRLGWSADRRTNGLPSARFLLPVGHPNSPFSRNVVLAFNDPARPLTSLSNGNNAALQVTFNATFGEWRATLSSKYEDRSRSYSYDVTGSIPGGLITLGAGTNPFAASPAGLIPINTTLTRTTNITRDVQLDLEGPLVSLPAGQLRLRAGLGGTWLSLDGASTNLANARHFRRREYEARAGLTIPLTGSPDGSPGPIGRSEFSIDAARSDLGGQGKAHSVAMALTWLPASWLRLTLNQNEESIAPAPELLAAPTTVTPNVRYFDPVTGQTVDVTMISGSSGALANEHRRLRHVSLNVRPWAAYNLQLNADLLITDLRDQAGPLPLPTPAVVAAFPGRFVRDSNGVLVQVDTTTVNFERQHTSELRTGLSFGVPLSAKPSAGMRGADGKPVKRSKSRPMLQVNASFTHVFASTTTIRSVLGEVDLLAGGAIGLAGSRARNGADGSVAISDRGVGIRAAFTWRGPSTLVTGTALAPDRLQFDSFTRFDLKLFADAAQVFGASPATRGLRMTLAVDNLLDKRQQVSNLAGVTPLGYQPIYRDPLGRLVSIELRKLF